MKQKDVETMKDFLKKLEELNEKVEELDEISDDDEELDADDEMKYNIFKFYEEGGIDEVLNNINSIDKIKNNKIVNKIFGDNIEVLAHYSIATLAYLSNALSFKLIYRDKEQFTKVLDKIIEIANEVKENI